MTITQATVPFVGFNFQTPTEPVEATTPRIVYKLADSAIAFIRNTIQESLVNEDDKAGKKLEEMELAPSTNDGADPYALVVLPEDHGDHEFKTVGQFGRHLLTTTIFHIGELVEFSIATHTNFVDHMRQVRLDEVVNKPGYLSVTPEYCDYIKNYVETLMERAKQNKAEMQKRIAQ